MTRSRLFVIALLVLQGCTTTPAPITTTTCPIDASVLARCERPASLPIDPGDAVLEIWSALEKCLAAVAVARDALEQAPADLGATASRPRK
jgi:hypothetical protein